jgi:ribosomal protein S18 acetylase RimI-like enzyme
MNHAEPAKPDVRLEGISQPDFDAWLARTIGEYAQEKVQAGNYHADEALTRAAQEFRELLPEGPATPGQHLFSIVDSASGAHVGVTWFAEIQRGPRREAFIYDLIVYEPFRRRGFGRAAMIALEAEVQRLGIERIGLHVFGHNRSAWTLYDQLGYEVTNVNMAKTITPQPHEDPGAGKR